MSRKRKYSNYINNICIHYNHGDITFELRDKSLTYYPWVIITVHQHHLDDGLDVEFPGLYKFSGFWYGDNALEPRSYGKVLPLSGNEKIYDNFINYKTKNLTFYEWDEIMTYAFEKTL